MRIISRTIYPEDFILIGNVFILDLKKCNQNAEMIIASETGVKIAMKKIFEFNIDEMYFL